MKLQLLVNIEVEMMETQPIAEFKNEDFKAFVPYLSEKIKDAIDESWQYNAKVNSVTITHKSKKETLK